jgi:ABC-type enterochelin transport system permease subunit
LIVIFVCSIIVTALGSIPFIGWILSLAIAPIFGVFVARSVSLIYLEGTATEEPEAKETA